MHSRRAPEVPSVRVHALNAARARPAGEYVLYWMVAQRRLRSSFPLEQAVWWCRELDRPLVIVETLRASHPHASPRLHRFILDGMADNARAAEGSRARYLGYVEPAAGHGEGLLEALSERACVVVTDEHFTFGAPNARGVERSSLGVRVEVVDGAGLVPMRLVDRPHPTAHGFRRAIQKLLPVQLELGPLAAPLDLLPEHPRPAVPRGTAERWPFAGAAALEGSALLERVRPALAHSVPPVAEKRGGAAAGQAQLEAFVAERLEAYGEQHNHPDAPGTSGLSPYLHFGHLGVHQVFEAVVRDEPFEPSKLPRAHGKRSGFYPVSDSRAAFLDQLVTWRELAYNGCHHDPGYAEYASLPPWARATLDAHRGDRRPELYSLDALEAAETASPLWNATQRQLLREGSIHGYLRMVWGKKILEWSESPEEAYARMVLLNDRYALDGRDPCSYSNIGWVLGKHDRPWGPERPIFGKVRYMSLANTAKKLRLARYLARYA